MVRYSLKSNAKINVYININFKKSSGYHDLDMINLPINLYDIINLEINDSNQINIEMNNIVEQIKLENNIIYKVINEFIKIEKRQFGINVKVYKEIPTQSGTGGASSNAAFILMKLYEHFNIKIDKEYLIKKYYKFGSDLPFFFYNKPAIVQSEGEIVVPKKFIFKKFYFVLIHPEQKNSTKDIYLILNEDVYGSIDNINYIYEELQKYNFKVLKNDFYKIVKNSNYDMIEKELYDLGAQYVNITGTGSTIFGIYPKEINAKNINNILSKKYKDVYICNVLN